MQDELNLLDIADTLFILDKRTVDTLFSLENGADCFVLYGFYYKTAKWQKTNIVKANDEYVKKSLKWGIDKVKRVKDTLKEKGLIQTVKKINDNGKIEGWYVQISYLVNNEKLDKIDVTHNTQKPLVVRATSGNEETNALIYNIEMLKNNNKMLEEENNKLKKEIELLKENNIIKENKEENINNINIKENGLEYILEYWNTKGIIKHSKINELMKKAYKKAIKDYGLTDEQIKEAIDNYDTMLKDYKSGFTYKWNLADFLSRENGARTFTSEGSRWNNYQYNKNKPFTVQQNNGLVSYEIDPTAPYRNRGDNDF